MHKTAHAHFGAPEIADVSKDPEKRPFFGQVVDRKTASHSRADFMQAQTLRCHDVFLGVWLLAELADFVGCKIIDGPKLLIRKVQTCAAKIGYGLAGNDQRTTIRSIVRKVSQGVRPQ
jgi:hypothetical protein